MKPSETRCEISAAEMAMEDTLELLEWQRLCEYLSEFASTKIGRNRCKKIQLPVDIATSRKLLTETLEIGALDKSLEGGLDFLGVHDLGDILLRCFKGGVATGQELLKVAETLAAARRLRRQVDDAEVRPVTTELLAQLATLPELEKLLRFGLEDGGLIADRASERLRDLRKRWHGMRGERLALMQKLLRRYGHILQDTAIGDRNTRPVLSVKAGAIDKIPGIVHGSSASGNTLYLEPEVAISLGNRISAVHTQIRVEEDRLLLAWSSAVGKEFLSLQHLVDVMLQLDLALARARFGHWLNGVPPALHEAADAPFVLNELHHPLLLCQQLSQKEHVAVPVTIEVASDLRVVAITGPNTGGKTVTLKSLGLAVLMARCGFLLPCSGNPSLPWCNQVLADIGDEQSLQQNLSTFSSHINRISRILLAIDLIPGPTVVLLDEVGAGTDPTEGTALAVALLRTLAEKVRLTIATTHFGGLKALKYEDSRFENASVAFDSETLKPTYHLQWGIPGRSNALEIARRLGLDSSVVDVAEEFIAPKRFGDIDNVIKGLEEQRQRQQTAAEEAALLLARTETLYEELLDRWALHRNLSNKMQEDGRKQIAGSIRQGQKEVRALIRRLRMDGANGETARQVGQRLRRLEAEHQPQMLSRDVQGWLPHVGDRVRLMALGKAAEVLAISEDGLQLTVLCGVFRSTVSLDSVESLDGIKPSSPQSKVKVHAQVSSGSSGAVRSSKNTLDVRGLRVHEAEVVVEEYLRRTEGPLWVVHGIGTGKLKQGLRQWLASISYVDKVVDANPNDGGPGCSIVWLK